MTTRGKAPKGAKERRSGLFSRALSRRSRTGVLVPVVAVAGRCDPTRGKQRGPDTGAVVSGSASLAGFAVETGRGEASGEGKDCR